MDIQHFDWSSFTVKTVVFAPVATLYNAWAVAAETERWFLSNADHFEGDRMLPKTAAVQPGETYAWNWHLFDVTEQGRFIAANGRDELRFTFAGACLVQVQLQDFGNATLVELTQSNIPGDDRSKREIRLGCQDGWSFYLVNLKSVYEGGIDLRNKDERFKGLVNN
jgi:uncharacterized protein YndB with AHSA1/START domain